MKNLPNVQFRIGYLVRLVLLLYNLTIFENVLWRFRFNLFDGWANVHLNIFSKIISGALFSIDITNSLNWET